MADSKISALPNASTLTGSEQIPVVQSGADVKATPNAILGLVSGAVSIAAGGTATINSVPASALPNPAASSLGGVQSKAAVSHQFLTSISTSGVPASAQPASADISDATSAGVAMLTAASAAAQTALLSNVGGDLGAGGTKGLVPAPAAGDAAAGKFLKADGTFAVPSGASMTYPGAGVPVSTGSAWGTSITLGTNVQTALGNALNGANGLVGYSGSLGAASGTSLSLGGSPIGGNALSIAGTAVISGAVTLGTQQTIQGSLVLANTAAGAYSTTIKASNSASAAWTLTLPTTAGTADYVLRTDGSGNTSWVAQSGGGGTPGGSANQLQFNSAGTSFGGAAALTYAASGTNLTVTAQNTTDVPLNIKGSDSFNARYLNVSSSSGTGDVMNLGTYGDLFIQGSLNANGVSVSTGGANVIGWEYGATAVGRDAGQIIALRSGTYTASAFQFRVYKDYSASNSQYAFIDAGKTQANTLEIGTIANGTGATNFTKLKFSSEGTTVLDYNVTNASALSTSVPLAFTKQAYFVPPGLTDGATISWDLALNQVGTVTIAGNRTMAAPTNMKNGAIYTLRVTQDGTGSRTLTWNAAFIWPNGVAPVLSTAAGAVDIFTFASDGTYLYGDNGLPAPATYAAKTANYTVTAQDSIIKCTTNAFTVTMLTSVGYAGQSWIIKNSNAIGSGNNITVATTSSQTIDGNSTATITPMSALKLCSDGANWMII